MYATNLPYSATYCPNLLANNHDNRPDNGDPILVNTWYKATHVAKKNAHLAGLQKDWYGSWLGGIYFPYLIIRFENIMFKPQKLLGNFCHCAGGILATRLPPLDTCTDVNDLQYTTGSSKGSQSSHAEILELVGV